MGYRTQSTDFFQESEILEAVAVHGPWSIDHGAVLENKKPAHACRLYYGPGTIVYGQSYTSILAYFA
jgi:hypothetical protein